MLHKLLHLAVIMDGNGRWATERNLPCSEGHLKGIDPVKMLIRRAVQHPDIQFLTLFVYSLENLKRPLQETQYIQDLLINCLQSDLEELEQERVFVRIIGDVAGIDLPVRYVSNPKLVVNLCFRYSGRWHISNIVNRLLAQNQPCTPDSIQSMMVADLGPDPDVIIRTGNEMRLSNFLLWNLAYSELFFLPVLWPDFSESHFDQVVTSYLKRHRRYGTLGVDDGL